MEEMGKTNNSNIIFPPEWHEQDGVMLTWPHEGTDWAPILAEVEETYLKIAREIIKREKLLVVCRKREPVSSLFNPEERAKIAFFEMETDDTWSRDHGPLATFNNGRPVVNDFSFNGWGGKFFSGNDNQITRNLYDGGAFRSGSHYSPHEMIMEGGSIETDGQGTLLSTSRCLLNPNRNGGLAVHEIENKLKETLGAERFLWLDHGHMEGDDTDGHIDTLARFCDRNTICYVSCSQREDRHYVPLKKMEQQLQGFRTLDGAPYRLVPLPMVPPQWEDAGKKLPATYANFLIINQAVLFPVYGVEKDPEAVRIMKALFPEREIVEVDCSVLIRQYGSLHCITMQIPKGFLR